MWILFAAASAVFAGLSAIFGKYGVQGADSDIATAVRTIIVLVFAWLLVFITGAQSGMGAISCRTWLFLVLSGLATGGASWLCYYHALQNGLVSVVVAVDKLSVLVTIAFAWLVFGERLTLRSMAGLVCILVGTLLLVLPPA